MYTIIHFILVLGVLVFIHELGHFLLAKMVGIRVERFSLGFPPRMIGKKIGDTDYCISWLPLGGYVKMTGMIDESIDQKIEGKPWEFMSKKLWQRFLVIFAGPFANLMLTVFLYGVIAWVDGKPTEPTHPYITQIVAESPAAEAGLLAGDIILEIDAQSVTTVEEAVEILNANPDVAIPIKVEREYQNVTLAVTPKLASNAEVARIGIGVGQDYIYEKIGLGEAIYSGATHTVYITQAFFGGIGKLISGEESVKENVAGPVGIAKIIGEVARKGWRYLFSFTAFLSLQLGLLNLLPIPALDGGHIVFLAAEGIMRRPPTVKTRVVVQQIGMAFLLALMVFIIFNDISKLF